LHCSLRCRGLFSCLFGGLFYCFCQFSDTLEHVLGGADLLLGGIGARDGFRRLSVPSLRRNSLLRACIC
jgi:hypothetical protein